MVLFRVIAGVFLYVFIRLSTMLSDKIAMLIVIVFLTVIPVYLLPELPFNIGYLNYATYHNPTQILLSAFAVPASLIALRAVIPQPFKSLNRRVFFTLLSTLLILAMSLSKPSYTIALLPSVSLLAVYRLARRLPVDWSLLVFGVILPQAFTLILQYLVAYGDLQSAVKVKVGFLVFFQLLRL